MKRVFPPFLFTLGFAAAMLAPALHAQSIYNCTDGKGRNITSDRPIRDCIDREQRELNASGTTRRLVGPSLTAQELSVVEAREQRQAEEVARQAEDRRRDRALLARYKNKDGHDSERGEALTQVDAVIAAAKKRVGELAREREQLMAEMEFYVKDPVKAPPSLKRQVSENEHSVALQQRFIGDQDAEKTRINARFDEELSRLKPLWAAQAGGVSSAAVKPASTSAVR